MLATNDGPGDGGRCRWTVRAVALVLAAGGLASAGAAPVPAAVQPPVIEEFVPIDELPEEDRLPAAPFLIAAYSIVWILAFGYFWLLSRRQSAVERDLAALSRRLPVPDNDDPPEAGGEKQP